MPPFVSVVMPVYNCERFVSFAIESILNQTYKNFEFIIIDDGSSDNTLSILKTYSKKDKRIKIIINQKNLNQSKSIKKALRLAKGEYFIKMDNDDISDEKRIEKEVYFMEKIKNM